MSTSKEYSIVYVVEDWSRPWARDLNHEYAEDPEGTLITCTSDTVSIDDFLEGCLPGKYIFTDEHGDEFILITGAEVTAS